MTCVVLVLSTITCWPVLAAPSVAYEANTLTHRLMSPYCPGLLLADCPSDGARALRAEIVQRLQNGERPEAIEDDFITRFGPASRTEPEFRGLALVFWFGLVVLGLASLVVLVRMLHCATSEHDPAAAGVQDTSQEAARLSERLDSELSALD
jgi:cytochrome c-type biogenesis protein CcmH/NrfF